MYVAEETKSCDFQTAENGGPNSKGSTLLQDNYLIGAFTPVTKILIGLYHSSPKNQQNPMLALPNATRHTAPLTTSLSNWVLNRGSYHDCNQSINAKT
ncbi:hypothetical protein OUZ56_010470 [Daphnia magna]|uniref:Uncharacterized protein n=1 Tax=Daphnia magna TaxID=35525 RepID=A0ABR0AIP3_9CRUS|nr:hypothetical protein OUZ56_010470 [Daphnia magna]